MIVSEALRQKQKSIADFSVMLFADELLFYRKCTVWAVFLRAAVYECAAIEYNLSAIPRFTVRVHGIPSHNLVGAHCRTTGKVKCTAYKGVFTAHAVYITGFN